MHDSSSPKRRPKEPPADEQVRHRKHALQAKGGHPPDAEEASGRNAPTVYRKDGKRVDPRDEASMMGDQRKVYRPTDEQMEWGMGVVQKRHQEEERDGILADLHGAFGRAPDDEALDRRLRQAQHWDDPMRAFLDQDAAPEDGLLGATKLSKKEQKKADKIWIERELARRLRYPGSFQPNRFGIFPGRRWDGVDRSNGFEKALFTAKAKAAEQKQRNFASEVQDI